MFGNTAKFYSSQIDYVWSILDIPPIILAKFVKNNENAYYITGKNGWVLCFYLLILQKTLYITNFTWYTF